MKLEPVAWDVRINGDSTVTAIKRRADEWRNVLGGEVIPLYAIPDGYVVVPVEQAKDAERLDYLQHNARCDPKMDGNHIWWPTSLNQAHRLTGSSLRTAIDKAMIAAKAES